MSNQLNPGKIVHLLTISNGKMAESTLSALKNSRQKALKKQSVQVPAFTLASHATHTSFRWTDRLAPHSTLLWIAAGLLAVILLAGTSYWQHLQEQQIDATDIAILTGDLPIDIFVK